MSKNQFPLTIDTISNYSDTSSKNYLEFDYNQYVNQIINKIKVKLQNQKNKFINNNFNSNDLLKIYQEVQLERLKIILNIKGSDIKLPNICLFP